MATPSAREPVFRIYREPVQFPVARRAIAICELVYLEPPVEIEILDDPVPVPVPMPDHGDHAILAILSADHPGESVRAAFERKEKALAALFASLAPVAARALERRLRVPSPGDEAALAFARLVPERKDRLVALLARAR